MSKEQIEAISNSDELKIVLIELSEAIEKLKSDVAELTAKLSSEKKKKSFFDLD